MRKVLCTLASVAIAFGSFAHADDQVPAPAPRVAPVKAVAKQLTAEELGTMLENLGYELKPVTNGKGEVVGYDTRYDAEGWPLNARIEFSPSGKFIWISGVVASIKDVKDVPKEAFVAMLAESHKLAPVQLQFDAKYNSVMLAVGMPNANFTPADMRTWMAAYTTGLKIALKSWDAAVKPTSVANSD